MRVQAIVIASCKVLGLLLMYQGCVNLLWGIRVFFMLQLSATSQFAMAVNWITPLVFLAAAFYVIRHADQIAFHLVGDLAEEPADFPQSRAFWVHLAYSLLALYFIADGVAQVGTAAGSLLVLLLVSPPPFAPSMPLDGIVGVALLLLGLLFLRRVSPRLKELSATQEKKSEEQDRG